MSWKSLAIAIGSLLPLVATTWLGISHAQSPANLRRIEVVAMNIPAQSEQANAFRQALREAGYVEGRDVAIEWWSGGGRYDHVADAVAGAVSRRADVIVTAGTPAALAAKRRTGTIPIVMALAADPVGTGLVPSLARPGGNVTGLSAMVVELSAKRLQLLKEALPGATRVGVIFNPDAPFNAKVIELLKAAAPDQGLTLILASVRNAEGFVVAFTELKRSKADVLLVLDDAFMAANEAAIFRMASVAHLAVGIGYKSSVEPGPLISYTADRRDMFRRAAGYVDRILKGASAADLPIEQPTRFELVVNLKAAKALGIQIPESLLLQATEVIE